MSSLLFDPASAVPLFAPWEDTMITSCLEGVMGKVYGDCAHAPASALAVLNDFAFLAGRPNRELVLLAMEEADFRILVPPDKGWSRLVEEVYDSRFKAVTRYATLKEPAFDYAALSALTKTVPEGLSLRPMDEALYRRCGEESWSRDLISGFPSWEDYRKLGLGMVLCNKSGEPLSGASSYSRYSRGIEIEIDTRPDCRRRGYARLCGAALILACQKQGLYPSWDAQNPGSLALSLQLGYRFSHAYPAYEVTQGI